MLIRYGLLARRGPRDCSLQALGNSIDIEVQVVREELADISILVVANQWPYILAR